MTRSRRWLTYGGVACAVMVAAWIYGSTIISPSPDVRRPPVEANRVVHPAGFSIVRPGRTRAILTRSSSDVDDQISILPAWGRSRYTQGLYVRCLREPPDPPLLERTGYQPGVFQGHAALIYAGPSGEYDDYRVMTERGGVWYEIAVIIPAGGNPPGSIPSPEWRRYMETFTPAATVATAATQPHNP